MVGASPNVPEVSIIIPAYNVREWIDQTLDSIWRQTSTDYEVIVVDDGSTDGLKAYLETRYPSRLKVIRQDNQGLSAARNTGIRHSLGRYYCFVDADDLILPHHLESLTKVLNSSLDVGVAYTDHTKFFDNPAENFDHPPKKMETSDEAWWCLFLQDNPIVSGGALVRKELVELYGGFDTSMVSCADWDFWFRLALNNVQFAYVAEKTLLYRQRSNSLSRNYVVKACADARVLEKGLEFSRKTNHPALKMIPLWLANRYVEVAQAYLYSGKRREGIRALVLSFQYGKTTHWRRRYLLFLIGMSMPMSIVKHIIRDILIGRERATLFSK